jgi:hypothetical protein
MALQRESMPQRNPARYVNAISNITVAEDRAQRRRTTRANLQFLGMLALLFAMTIGLLVLVGRLVALVVPAGAKAVIWLLIRLAQVVVWMVAWTYVLTKSGFLLLTRQRSFSDLSDTLRQSRSRRDGEVLGLDASPVQEVHSKAAEP